jgi:acetyl esterase/lipase
MWHPPNLRGAVTHDTLLDNPMPVADIRIPAPNCTTIIDIAPGERAREAALRERFASFWSAARGEPRAVYDEFIAACPLAAGIVPDAVIGQEARGWWVRPMRPEAGCAMLYLHGGGYVQGSATAYLGFASQLVSRTGVPALVIDYPLAPEATLPAACAAALAAWRWLVGQGFSRIAIAGDSAGGGLALSTLAQLARSARSARDRVPVAGVAFSPWTDLALTGASMADPAVVDPLISAAYLRDCARQYLGSADPHDPLASPLYSHMRGLPPLFVQVGADECLLDDSRRYAERARQAGTDVRLEVWQGMHHVFQLDVAHLESSRIALDRAAQFLLNAFNPA